MGRIEIIKMLLKLHSKLWNSPFNIKLQVVKCLIEFVFRRMMMKTRDALPENTAPPLPYAHPVPQTTMEIR